MSYDRGDTTTVRIRLKDADGNLADPNGLVLHLWLPDGTKEERKWPGGEVNKEDKGVFVSTLELKQSGTWYGRWESEGDPQLAENFFLVVGSDPFGAPVTDLRDTRVLIPSIRRALEGPASLNTDTKLLDSDVNSLIADAVSNVILYTGGLFGHQLNVVGRDPAYLAPNAWLIDPAMSEDEAAVIRAQAALDYFFMDLKNLKVQQTIKDEATEWSWQLSANALNEYLKHLRKARDEAIERIADAEAAPAEGWINLLAERDAYVDAVIEPWARGAGGGGLNEFVV